jgi:hypothetical protein
MVTIKISIGLEAKYWNFVFVGSFNEAKHYCYITWWPQIKVFFPKFQSSNDHLLILNFSKDYLNNIIGNFEDEYITLCITFDYNKNKMEWIDN